MVKNERLVAYTVLDRLRFEKVPSFSLYTMNACAGRVCVDTDENASDYILFHLSGRSW